MSALAAMAFAAAAAKAGVVAVTIDNVTIPRGTLYVMLCREREFMTSGCFRKANRTITRSGSVKISFANVPSGVYAVQAIQDVNGNRRLDRDFYGLPTEPAAFSGAQARAGKVPAFADHAFAARGSGRRIIVRLGR